MILLDSNVWIALFNKEDSLHGQASNDFTKIIERKEEIIVTDYVILEVATILQQRAGQEMANSFLEHVLSAEGILLINIDEMAFTQVVEFFKKDRHKLSFVDASIVILNKNMGVKILTFDKDLTKEIKAH